MLNYVTADEAVKLINDTAAEIWNKAAEMMKL